MAKVEIYVNSKVYQIGCADSDQKKLQEYMDILSERIEQFKQEDSTFFMGLNNERIFLLQAITLIEELYKEKAKNAQNNNDSLFSNISNKLGELLLQANQIKSNIKK